MNTQIKSIQIKSIAIITTEIVENTHEFTDSAAAQQFLASIRSATNPTINPTINPATRSTPFSEKSPKDKILEMLNHSQYTLRSIESIQEKTGLYGAELHQVLDEIGEDLVYRTRHSNGESLVGLASRNY